MECKNYKEIIQNINCIESHNLKKTSWSKKLKNLKYWRKSSLINKRHNYQYLKKYSWVFFIKQLVQTILKSKQKKITSKKWETICFISFQHKYILTSNQSICILGSAISKSLHLAFCNSLLISAVITGWLCFFNKFNRASLWSLEISALYLSTKVKNAWCHKTGNSLSSCSNLQEINMWRFKIN